MERQTKSHYCYILKNSVNNKTYNGYTVNPAKRLRQHNGEIKGGAKATSTVKGWYIIALLSGFPNDVNALQCEWRIKHPTNSRKRLAKHCGPEGRIKGLNEVLKLDRWTSNSTVDNRSFDITVKILDQYRCLLSDLPDNVFVESL